jgi:hypothetical protein
VVLFLIVVMLLCTGCKEKEEVKVPALSDPNETIITETILWENVLVESWL